MATKARFAVKELKLISETALSGIYPYYGNWNEVPCQQPRSFHPLFQIQKTAALGGDEACSDFFPA